MPIHDVSTYVHENHVPPEFYIQHLLAKRGSMMLYGGAGVKKSWLVQYMCFCLSTGTEWLGFRTEQARVVLCNFEISPAAFVVYRLRPMERQFALQVGTLFENSIDGMRLEDIVVARRFIEEMRPVAPNVVVLDCLQGCYGGDENDMATAGLWIESVREMQRELNCAVVVVHHSNKNQLASSMGRVRGTTRFTAWVDSVVCMVVQPVGIQLQFEKYRLSAIPELGNLNIAFENYVWHIR